MADDKSDVEKRDKYVRSRVSKTMKKKFMEKLLKDGITQSIFFNACIMNYLGIDASYEKKYNL